MIPSKAALALTLFSQILVAGLYAAHSASVVGTWSVEISFENGENRLFRFESRESGQGSFLLLDPHLKVWGPAKPSDAKWTQSDDGAVIFSGAVEFPLGNVGRDAGTLVLKGKFGPDGSISGEAVFFRVDQGSTEPKGKPSKSGSFKATRSGS